MRQRIPASMLLSAALLCLAPAALAQDFSCSIADPAGDPFLSPGHGFDGEAWQDIVETAVERSGATVTFTMTVADAIPEAPALRTPEGMLLWMWGMSTEPGVPKGLPLSPGLAGILDFWIHVSWDGSEWEAIVIDRRPAAIKGGEPIVTSVPFSVEGNVVQVVAPAELFGDLGSFNWGSSTWMWSSPLGTAAAHVVDRAPNGAVPRCVVS